MLSRRFKTAVEATASRSHGDLERLYTYLSSKSKYQILRLILAAYVSLHGRKPLRNPGDIGATRPMLNIEYGY